MKKQYFRLYFITLFVLMMFVSSIIIPEEVYAGSSAKSILEKATKVLDDSVAISGRSEVTRNIYLREDTNDVSLSHRVGFFIEDDDMSYGIYLDGSQSECGWEEYVVNENTFRKSYYSSYWDVYTDSDYDNESEYGNTFKDELSFLLKNVKSPKIKSTTRKSYVISGTFDKSIASWKSINLVVDKKTNKISKIKLTYKKHTNTLLNSPDTYTVTSGSFTCSNISYSDNKVTLPEELNGI